MQVLGEARRHFWLAKKMADLNGVDLDGAYAKGDLDQEAWSDLIEECRKCDWSEGCERYLARGEAGAELPENCRNRLSFTTLRAWSRMEKRHGNQ